MRPRTARSQTGNVDIVSTCPNWKSTYIVTLVLSSLAPFFNCFYAVPIVAPDGTRAQQIADRRATDQSWNQALAIPPIVSVLAPRKPCGCDLTTTSLITLRSGYAPVDR